MRLKIILGSVLVVAILVAGCGGGGGDTSSGSSGATGATTGSSADEETAGGSGDSSSSPLSKVVFVKKGDEVCTRVPANYGKLLQTLEKENKANGKAKTSTSEGNLKAAVPPLYTAVEEFEALTPPSGDEQKAEAITDALEAAAKGLEEEPSSELSGPKSPFAEFQKLTGEYGFKACSQL
jgi:hypothetical protein